MFDQFASATSTSTNTPRFDKTGQTVRDRECKRFDGKLHAELTAAKTVGEWEKLADKIIKAAKVGNYRDPHGLRDTIRDRFLNECPFGPVKRRYYEGVGQKANAPASDFSMLDHLGKQERKGPPLTRLQKLAKRRDRDVKTRAEMRGSTSGSQQSSKKK